MLEFSNIDTGLIFVIQLNPDLNKSVVTLITKLMLIATNFLQFYQNTDKIINNEIILRYQKIMPGCEFG